MLQLRDIVGQDAAITHLGGVLSGTRRPHAFIFAGPIGIGRRTTAEALAGALLCSQPADASETEACGDCDDCRMMTAGTHPDFHPVAKELAAYHSDSAVRSRVMQELSIDVIRQFLIAPAGQAPSRGRGKVFVVSEAELMSVAAQNALLKTLEEPPRGVTIVLLCRQTDQLLATTLSRCALVRFGPLPAEFVTDGLVSRGVEAAEASFWARSTAGSIGRSIRLAEAELYPIKQELTESLADLPPGGDEDLAERLVKLTDELAEAAVAATREADGSTLSKALATRQATGTLLQLIASAFQDALTLAVGADRPLCHADQAECIEGIARRMSASQLADVIEQLSAFERMLWQNVNAKIVWDNAVITCASAAPLGG